MNKLQIRTLVVKETGRYDLVGVAAGVADFTIDNGIDAYIEQGQMDICDRLPQLMAEEFWSTVLAIGENSFYVPRLKVPQLINIFDANFYVAELQGRSIHQLFHDLGQAWPQVTAGSPIYFGFDRTSEVSPKEIVTDVNMNAALAWDTAEFVWGAGVFTKAGAVAGYVRWVTTNLSDFMYLHPGMQMVITATVTPGAGQIFTLGANNTNSTVSSVGAGAQTLVLTTTIEDSPGDLSSIVYFGITSLAVAAGSITSLSVQITLPPHIIYMLPSSDSNYPTIIRGLFYPPIVTTNTGGNWLMLHRPWLLVRAVEFGVAKAYGIDIDRREADYLKEVTLVDNDSVHRDITECSDDYGYLEIEEV